MEASSTVVVIKVKYGDTLRRFNAQIIDGKLTLNIGGLRQKALSLFSLPSDTELMLTYVDEDGDVVALVDDDDLRDVVKQGLNPLRITVKLNDGKNSSQYNYSSASSTPLRSPRVQQSFENLNAGVSEILRKVPEPLRETLVKLSGDLVSKASSSAPALSELVDSLSKVSLSHLGQLSESQPGTKSSTVGDVPESSTAAKETKDSGLFKVDPAAVLEILSNVSSDVVSKNNEWLEKIKPQATVERNEVQNLTGRSVEGSSFDFNAVAAALESQNNNVAQPGKDSLQNLVPVPPESGGVSYNVGKKEKAKKMVKSSTGKSHLTSDLPAVANNVGEVAESSDLRSLVDDNVAGKEVRNPSKHKSGSNPANTYGKAPAPGWAPHTLGSSFGPIYYPSTMTPCPFSGTILENISAAPTLPAFGAVPVPFRRSSSQNESSGNILHRGVRCDGCGVHPITGPRFKSKVKVDYDLCRICFEKMGNDSDYIRMDRPAFYRHHMSFKGLHDARAREQDPAAPHVCRGPKVKLGAMKLDSRFIQDVNIFDGTVMTPVTPFTKIWRMRNNGTLVWPQKTQLVWIGGDKLSNALSVEVQIPEGGLLIDQELDVAVDFISPELPGRYISYWRMASPSDQKFGQRVWVLIQVDASVKEETNHEIVRNLNLNLPPVNSSSTGPEIISVYPEPVVEGNHHEADNSKKMVEVVKPNTDQALKIPNNYSLVVGNGASSSAPSSSSPSVSYPFIDLSDFAPPVPSASAAMFYPIAPPVAPAAPVASVPAVADAQGKEQVEEKLLKELEEMGFKQVDLNKEVLRLNEYDLEQAVDDLCGVSEWDPILEELQEMGFHDREMNKVLLKKNNGSIKRVVMDLIAGEEN